MTYVAIGMMLVPWRLRLSTAERTGASVKAPRPGLRLSTGITADVVLSASLTLPANRPRGAVSVGLPLDAADPHGQSGLRLR
jgi:hypothetical protein